MKGLPAGYQKDLQEDKEAVFDAVDTATGSVAVMTGVVAGLALEREVMRKAARREEMMAAGLAVALAREGMPFRKAHGVVGRLVAQAQKSGRSLKAVAADELKSSSPAVAARLDQLFDPWKP
jgi:argininosuccinate lyase